MQLRHAAFGYGVMGAVDAEKIAATGRAEVVAVCDEDQNNLRRAAEAYPGARLYSDWRALFAREMQRIDSVSISTRDHAHAPIALAAMQGGKHVYCQKPLTHRVGEARQLAEAAKQAGVATQMGIQIHSHAAYRNAVALIKSGAIGAVRQVHAWSSDSSVHPDMQKPAAAAPPPDHLNWDNWLGVAPSRPFKPVYLYTWHAWKDFGNGVLGNVGCHVFDPIVTALEPGAPVSIEADVDPAWNPQGDTWPAWEVIRYRFANDLALTWYDGGKLPPQDLWHGEELPANGALFVGDTGVMLLPHFKEAILLPRDRFADTVRPDLGHVDHYMQWIDACFGGPAPSCGFDYAGPLTELVLLGALAVCFAGQRLDWNAAAMRVENLPQANAQVAATYRDGWHLDQLYAYAKGS